MAKNSKKPSKYGFLGHIYLQSAFKICMNILSKFAQIFLVVGCTYTENWKGLLLLFFEIFNFEFFQNFEILKFRYKT